MLTEKSTSIKLLGVASSSSSAGACFFLFHIASPGEGTGQIKNGLVS